MSDILRSILLKPIEITYAICAVSLFLIGTNFLVSTIIYMKNWRKAWGLQTPEPPAEWPHVTVQLPIYNERYLAERILKAVTQFDYPPDKLEIQVLDDSTDWTTNLLIGLVEKYRRQGVDIIYLHREDRYGFKAGNLSFGLKYAKGEFTAIFDADFIPPRNWLKRTVPFFDNPKVGFVQTRWDHINFAHNMISRMAGLTLDGHFVVEQSARSTAGLIMGFNGSGGIWRVAAIESVGGWQWDTMTEDVDMTFRSQFKGWEGRYLVNLRSPAEVPQELDDFKLQQYRWCKGTAQVALKLMGQLPKSDMPFKKKYFGMIHLLSYLTFPLGILLLLLVLPISLWSQPFLQIFWWAGLASIGPILLFMLAKTEHAPRLIDRLKVMPSEFLIGVGISLICALSVISGGVHRGKGGTFIRTTRVDPRIGKAYDKSKRRVLDLFILGEYTMGTYLLLSVIILWPTSGKYLLPWLGGSALGFYFVASVSLWDRIRKKLKPQTTQEESTSAV
jgi:cellulose synthase/poly-beta-1,6-N-acetylglucosamine synthase-like glycosyltransferase